MRPKLWSVYIGAALALLTLAYFYYVQPNLNARVIDISLVLGCLLILNVFTLAKTPPAARTIGVSFTAITLGIGALSLIGRAVYFLLAPLYTDLFAPTWINGLFLCLAALAVAGFSVGVILLSDERLMNDLKDAQTKIVHANRELAEAIEHARSMAERAARSDSAKSEFVAMISHEIRNPLAAIMATTELLLDTEMTQEQQDYLNAVNRAANALHALTDDALDLSQIEAGQLTIEAYRIDLHRIVADVSEIFSPSASKKGLELIVKYPPDLPYRFIGDAGRIRQVITNLAGNAIKFTARGYVRIDVDCKSKDAQQAKMRISVSDSGTGIPPQRIGAIFQAFGPVSKSASGKHTGTGMGLAISKRLADLMGGHLQVESSLAGVRSSRLKCRCSWITKASGPRARVGRQAKSGAEAPVPPCPFNRTVNLGYPIRGFACIGSRSVYLARNGEGPVNGLD
jgi:signal transduction histidine kinase